MAESSLQKVITFENNQLLCNGEPISIEEAERIIQEQVRDYEDSTAELIKNSPEFSVENIGNISDAVSRVRVHAGNAELAVRGLEEFKSTANDIIKGHELADYALKIFAKNLQKKVKVKAPRTSFKPEEWPLNTSKNDNYEPTMDELYEKYHELIFQNLIYNEFKNQFHNVDMKIGKEEISVYGNLVNEYRIYIKNKAVDIYFQINENDGSFGEISGNYIGSGLRLGEILLQSSKATLLRFANNNFKSAQTIENIVVKQVRFLKNTIKQEINYSLDHNI